MAEEKMETVSAAAENAEAAVADAAKAPAADSKRKKGGRYVPSGIAFILATFNNTKVTFTDLHGNVLCWSSSGKNGFKGSRKSTAYAAQVVAADAAKKAEQQTIKNLNNNINSSPGSLTDKTDNATVDYLKMSKKDFQAELEKVLNG